MIEGRSSTNPCNNYEIGKNYDTNSLNLPNELNFIIDKLSIYTGEDTSKLLRNLERLENKISNLVTKNTKANKTSHNVYR